MGEVLSSFLFQPPVPSRLKEDKLIWLSTSRGKRIPACYIEYARTRSGTVNVHSKSAKDIEAGIHGGGGGGADITILYSHANAEDLGNIYPWCKFLSKTLRVNVFAYDYTGYGLASSEEPTEEDCYADIDAAYRYIRQVLGVPARNIVLYGRSLGSGPSCYLAARTADESGESTKEKTQDSNAGSGSDKETEPVGGIILHAPFASVYRVVVETGCTLPGDKFPNIDFAQFIRSPLMLIHGTEDKIVPHEHSEQLLAAVNPNHRALPLFIEGMGHNNVHPLIRPLFVDRIGQFLREKVRGKSAGNDSSGKGVGWSTDVADLVARGCVASPIAMPHPLGHPPRMITAADQ